LILAVMVLNLVPAVLPSLPVDGVTRTQQAASH
jgi:hypothetical protein